MRKEDYQQYRGLSNDTKPRNADIGVEFLEIDTGDTYYSAGNGLWFKPNATPVSLSSIAITTQPTKVNYKKGELLSYDGMVVTATLSDSKTYTIPFGKYSVSVAEGTAITENKTSTITFSYKGVSKTATQTINLVELSSIAVDTEPTKTEYTTDEELTMAGLVITATYDDSTTEDVEYGDTRLTYSPEEGTVVTESGDVTITMTHEGVSKTTTQAITFSEEE